MAVYSAHVTVSFVSKRVLYILSVVADGRNHCVRKVFLGVSVTYHTTDNNLNYKLILLADAFSVDKRTCWPGNNA